MVIHGDRRLRRTRNTLSSTQEELLRQTGLLDLAGRAAHFGGWTVDLRTNQPEWSHEVYRIHGLPRAPVSVAEGIDFYVPEHRAVVTAPSPPVPSAPSPTTSS